MPRGPVAIYQFPSNRVDKVPIQMVISAKAFTREDEVRAVRNGRAILSLPLPPEMSSGMSHNYGEQSKASTQSVWSRLGNWLNTSWSASEWGNLPGILAFGIPPVSAWRWLTGAANAEGERSSDERIMEYSSTNFRVFSFSWLFICKNEQESSTLSQAIFELQYRSAPQISIDFNDKMGTPSLFDIDIFTDGTITTNWTSYIPIYSCFLTSIQFSPTPLKAPYAMGDTQPLAWSLNLTFVEVEPLVAAGRAFYPVSQAQMNR